jgi:hypothetical protein
VLLCAKRGEGWVQAATTSLDINLVKTRELHRPLPTPPPTAHRPLSAAHQDANVCSAVPNLIQFSWNLKIFYGAAQDAFPISGKHRIPSILAGWVLVVGMALVLVFFAGESALFQITVYAHPHRLPSTANRQPSTTHP